MFSNFMVTMQTIFFLSLQFHEPELIDIVIGHIPNEIEACGTLDNLFVSTYCRLVVFLIMDHRGSSWNFFLVILQTVFLTKRSIT